MKPLAINLSKMKKVAGDKKSSTFQHPDGHHIMIAHAGVSALHRKQMESMPVVKMAEGGLIDYDKADYSHEQAPADAPYGTGVPQAKAPGVLVADNGPVTPAQASMIPAPQVQVPGDGIPSASPIVAAPGFDIGSAYQQGQKAISEQQAVDVQKSKAAEDIQTKDLADREALNKSFEDHHKEFSEHQKQFIDDYAKDHVNPNHYMESMNVGGKIGTAIGLLLGGAASGTLGTNPAMDFLQKQIDRDIDSQKVNIDKKKTLLGANHELYQDDVTALNHTRINMNDIYDHKIQLAAAKLGTPQAKAAADAAHAKFGLENAALLQQSAMRSAALKDMQNAGNDESRLQSRMRFLRLSGGEAMAKDMESKHIPGVGDASREVPPDVVKELAGRQDLQNKIEDLQAFASQHGGSLDPATVNAGRAKAALVQDAYRRANAQGVFKEAEKNFVESIVHSEPTQFFQKYRSGQGYQQMNQDNLGTLNNLKGIYGLPTSRGRQMMTNPLEGKTATNSQGQKIVMQGGRWVPVGK